MDSTLTTKETDSKTKMSLENTFGKAEKVEEKKLEVIASANSVVDELRVHFEKNKYEGWHTFKKCKKFFNSYTNFLQKFELTPKIILEFNTKIGSVEEKEAFGLYLSALIQTSYNKGCNNFKFEEVNATCFGGLLKGQPKKPIKITAETLNGNWSLSEADGCLAEITNYKGEYFGEGMRKCIIKSGKEETLEIIKEQAWEGNNKFELKK